MARRVRIPGEQNHNLYESTRADGQRLLELGYRDSTGKQRWKVLGEVGIKEARAERDELLGKRGKGKRVVPSKLRFGEAAERWLAEEVTELRPATRSAYSYAIRHPLARWRRRRLDAITMDDAATLVRELRAEGKAEWTIAGALGAANQVFGFARRYMAWQGTNPIPALRKRERPHTGSTPRRRIFRDGELEQTLDACGEPWKTLFWLAAVTAARESELLGLKWQDLDLGDPEDATLTIAWQVDRKGNRAQVKTEAGERTIALPRQMVKMLLEHRARALHTRPTDFVFATKSGRPLGQRNCLRALRQAQLRARTPDGKPTFPVLFEAAPDEHGRWIPRKGPVPRNALPHIHSLRHTAASEAIAAGESVEEVSWMLGHRDSVVTKQVYTHELKTEERRRRRRALLEERYGAALEASLEATDGSRRRQTPEAPMGEVLDLREVRDSRQ
jgi:integrase